MGAVFTGDIYCPDCGERVTLTAGLATSGVSRDGNQLRAEVCNATANHSCRKRRD